MFKTLGDEWRARASGPEARAAASKWAQAHPVLAGMASPAEVVERCQQRGDTAHSAAVLRAVLSEVGNGPWPARTVLQAVLPGLTTVIRRCMHLVGADGPWQHHDELDQHVVALAYDRMAALAGDPPAWPAAAIVDGTWQRLRTAARVERRRAVHQAVLEEASEYCGEDPRNAGEDLVEMLASALALGLLDEVEGWLVYASRIEDRPMEVLGSQFGHSSRWGWRRRKHAEEVLRGARVLVAPGR